MRCFSFPRHNSDIAVVGTHKQWQLVNYLSLRPGLRQLAEPRREYGALMSPCHMRP